MEALAWLAESRLSSSAPCRCWTEASGCQDSIRWDRTLGSLPFPRGAIESARLRISNALSTPGLDPLGIFRSLLVHESSASIARQWLREIGFVHLDAASGIHLYCAWGAIERWLRKWDARGRIARAALDFARFALPLGVWAIVWALAGFRPGLIRPLLLLGVRRVAERRGWRLARYSAIGAAIAIDAALGFVFAYGRAATFEDWAPGEMHYALSWWGGALAAEAGEGRSWPPWKRHLALGFGAWAAVLPLELCAGRFAPATPLLSFLTIEILARGGYALALGAAVACAAGAMGAQTVLQWESTISNRAIGFLAEAVTRLGGFRKIGL